MVPIKTSSNVTKQLTRHTEMFPEKFKEEPKALTTTAKFYYDLVFCLLEILRYICNPLKNAYQ